MDAYCLCWRAPLMQALPHLCVCEHHTLEDVRCGCAANACTTSGWLGVMHSTCTYMAVLTSLLAVRPTVHCYSHSQLTGDNARAHGHALKPMNIPCPRPFVSMRQSVQQRMYNNMCMSKGHLVNEFMLCCAVCMELRAFMPHQRMPLLLPQKVLTICT